MATQVDVTEYKNKTMAKKLLEINLDDMLLVTPHLCMGHYKDKVYGIEKVDRFAPPDQQTERKFCIEWELTIKKFETD